MSVRNVLLTTVCLAIGSGGVSAQDSDPDAAPTAGEAVTTIDPEIPIDQLEVVVKPLTKAELAVEAQAWFELLRNKAKQIAAARLAVKKTNEALASGDRRVAVESLQTAQAVTENANAEAERALAEITRSAQENLGVAPQQDADAAGADTATGASAADEAAADSTDANAGKTTSEAEPTQAAEQTESAEEASSEPAPTADGEAQPAEAATELKDALLADVAELQDERTALADRLAVILDSLEAKGGEVQEYRDYTVAVSGIEVDTTDASATWAAVTGWLVSKEGGQRWAWNLGKFVLILLITYLLAKLIAGIVNWLLERKLQLAQLAERLISRTIKNVVFLVGFAVALTALEIDITPILAAIGAAGLVVGLALQGTLSNFASGLMILINRPFDVGNVVTAGGITGVVNQMNLVSTTFRTFDNQTIHVPNNEIWNNVITNITANQTRRVDLEFGISYDDDFERAEEIIRDVVSSHELVLEDPAPVVVTHALADSSVNVICWPWAKTSDWWQVKTEVTREVKRRFDQAGLTIPYPQRDVHVHNVDPNAGRPLQRSATSS